MSNKSQRAVFLQAKKNENKEIILIDSQELSSSFPN